MDSDGSFVVVWLSFQPEASVVGRRYAPNGVPMDEVFQVTDELDGQFEYAVLMASDHRFLVTWSWDNQIQGRWYDENGTPDPAPTTFVEEEVLLLHTSVALQPEGQVVAVWVSGGPYSLLKGQRFESDGTPLTPAFSIGPEVERLVLAPIVGTGPSGEFLVTYWSAINPNSSSPSAVFGQRFTADGTSVEPTWQVAESAGLPQDVMLSNNGTSLLLWQRYEVLDDFSKNSLMGRRFTVDGQVIGSDFQLNLSFPDDPEPNYGAPHAAAAMTPDGRFVVAWRAGDHLYYQRFSEAGIPMGLTLW